MRLPSPLPGLGSGEALTPLLSWAVGLLWSPRMRESDAGGGRGGGGRGRG